MTPVTDGAAAGNCTYDFIIAGAGLSGSVLASRLSEDPKKRENNPNITSALNVLGNIGSSLDYNYESAPQTNADSKPIVLHGGRALGGSTVINAMAWTMPHDYQIDALETLGNPGLNWNSLRPFMLMSETGTAPSESQIAAGLTWDPSCHGVDGPIQAGQANTTVPGELELALRASATALGLPTVTDNACGNPAGINWMVLTQKDNLRSDAYRSYLLDKERPNLTILTGAQVGRVLFTTSDGTPRTTGVEYKDASGNIGQAQAGLEVILSTGALRTPAILQYSGIGPKAVLDAAGVEQMLELPIGVGFSDRPSALAMFAHNATAGTAQALIFPQFLDLFTEEERAEVTAILDDLPALAQDAVDHGAAADVSHLLPLLELQKDWLLNKGVGVSEHLSFNAGPGVFGFVNWYTLPFGRGSLNITTNDPYSGQVNRDPRYWSNRFDLLASAAALRYTRMLATGIGPLLASEISPGLAAVPADASLDQYADWLKQGHYETAYHYLGGASMKSRELGGSVNPKHQVYGTQGLRVMDASILHMQVSAHMMRPLYGLAERFAAMLKAEYP